MATKSVRGAINKISITTDLINFSVGGIARSHSSKVSFHGKVGFFLECLCYFAFSGISELFLAALKVFELVFKPKWVYGHSRHLRKMFNINFFYI